MLPHFPMPKSCVFSRKGSSQLGAMYKEYVGQVNELEKHAKTFKSLNDLLDSQHTPVDTTSSFKRYLEMKAREKGVPLHGFFELTPLCNLDCKMCYVHLSLAQLGERKLLSVDQWKALMHQAVAEGLMYATLTGGECLLYPDFDELYLYLQSQGVQVGVITNGILLTEERIRFFTCHPPASIQVSFYGASEEGYERVTGHRKFSLVKENTLRAKAAGLPVKAGITSSKFMGTEDEDLINLLIKLQIPFTLNSTLFSARPETGRNLAEYDQSKGDFIRLRKAYVKYRQAIIPEPCSDPIQRALPVQGIQCGAGNSGFSIDWQGRMFACMMLPDIMADSLTDGFSKAWKFIHAKAKIYPLPQECNSCTYKKICTQCVAAHRNGALPGHANPQLCILAKALVESKKGENMNETRIQDAHR